MTAGLIFGKEVHHLDHLAPLCATYSIPLILTDERMLELAKNFYLDLEIIHFDEHSAAEKVVTRFDTIVYSTPRVLFDEVFYFVQAMHGKKVRTIWCPHGNSDKGRHTPFMEALREEEILLTYGPRMDAFLEEKGVMGTKIPIGNYRLAYYKRHKAFYDNLLDEKAKPSVLYAPTWRDQENNSSFEMLAPYLSKAPEHLNLIVKLHPNLYAQYPIEIEDLRDKGVQFIDDFPAVYPLLSQADLLITDTSSIGYDYLAFKKPLILTKDSPLREAGTLLTSPDALFEMADTLIGTNPPQNRLYEETFSRFARRVPLLQNACH